MQLVPLGPYNKKSRCKELAPGHQVKENTHASGCALFDRTDNGCRRSKPTCHGAHRELPGLRPCRSNSTARRWLSGRPPPARSNRRLSEDGFVRTFLVNAFEAMDLLATEYTRDSLSRNAEFRKGRKNFKNLRNSEDSGRRADSESIRGPVMRAPERRMRKRTLDRRRASCRTPYPLYAGPNRYPACHTV